MQELITKNYNGFAIEFELIDGQLMANATSMCAPFGKRPGDWTKTAAAKRFIEAKGRKIVLNENQMVYTRNGGNDNGTWIHECLIRKLAEWLDVDFELQCDEWIAELLRTGKVELQPILSPAELLLKQCQQLVDHERRVHHLEALQAADHKQIGVLGEQVAEVAAKQTTIDSKHYAVSGYASLMKIHLPASAAKARGKMAAQLSREQSYAVGKLPDGKWGEVNSYHLDILRQAFALPLPAPAPKARRATVRR